MKIRQSVALVPAQRAEEGLVSGTLPNHDGTGATDDKDLSPWYDHRPCENDRLSGEWACHEGTRDDDNALCEEGPLHEERPLLHEEGSLHEERPLPERRSALESETAARDDLAMPSREGA
jgi:hypothetical protein